MGFPGGNKGDRFKHEHLVECLTEWDIDNYIEFHSGVGISFDPNRYEGSSIRAIRTMIQTNPDEFQARLHEKDKSNRNRLKNHIKKEFPNHQSNIDIYDDWQTHHTRYLNLGSQSLVLIDPTFIRDYNKIIKLYLAQAMSSQAGFILYAPQTSPKHEETIERLLTTTHSRKPNHLTQKEKQRTDHLIMVSPRKK